MSPDFKDIQQVIDRHLPVASADEAKIAGTRVWQRLRTSGDRMGELETRLDEAQPVASAFRRKRTRWVQIAAAAVLVLAAAIGTAVVWRPADDGLYRVVEGAVHQGPTIRSNGDGGAVLALADGSRVEMRSQTELSLERASDGVRIRLSNGGIIVDAATRTTGHLYVHTKDVTVSVVGTVFLVNADERGSRVAGIEGEVRVQQGGNEKTLLPGEQVATNPQLPPPPVGESIAWSRNAAALTALLQQAAVVPPAVTPQNPAAAREAFEVASIRPTRFAPGGERGAGGGGGQSSPRPAGEPCGSTGSGFLQFDPRRVAINDMTLYGLIAWAYELPCRPWIGSHVLVGGPGWVRSDGYDIEALFPDGPQAYTSTQITGGGKTFTRQTMGPRFRTLLQTLLADRFGLALRRERREVPVYALTVAPGGAKVTAWKEGDPGDGVEFTAWRARNGTLLSEEELALTGMTAAEVIDLSSKNFNQLEMRVFRAYRDAGIRPLYTLADAKVPMSSLATMIDRTFANENWRPVIDRTGITIPINYVVRYDRNAAAAAVGPSIFTALEKDLGLRLTPTTAPMDVVVIERAERPSEN